MPPSADPNLPARRRLYAAVAMLIAAGYALTLLIFYPGIMTYDAKFVYEDIAGGVLGDWQSPVMTVLWGVIDPLAPGAASMFLLIATSYWLAFGLVAFALVRRAFASLVMPRELSNSSQAIEEPPASVAAAFLHANPRLGPQSVVITCSGQGSPRLREVRICLDRDLAPRACSTDALHESCRAPRVIIPPIH